MSNHHDHEMAEHLADQLVGDMISNWLKISSPITIPRYSKRFPAEPWNYGVDMDDPLNIIFNDKENDSDDDDYYLLEHDHIIHRIPLLINRRDTMPELRIWLPLLRNILWEKFLEHRSQSGSGDFENRAAVMDRFQRMSLPAQLATVARAFFSQETSAPTRRPRRILPACFCWRYIWKEVHVGVVKLLPDDNKLQIVTFPIKLDSFDEIVALDAMRRKIHLARNGYDLDQNVFQVWCLEHSHEICETSGPEIKGNNHSNADTHNAEKDDGVSNDSSNDDEVPVIRCASDVFGSGPFDIDIWYRYPRDRAYTFLPKLVQLWGVRGVLFIPAHKVHRLFQICRHPDVAGKPFVSPGYSTLYKEPPLFDVIRRGFAVWKENVKRHFHAPSRSTPSVPNLTDGYSEVSTVLSSLSDPDLAASHNDNEQREVNLTSSELKIDWAILET
ncbi:hypothetical protein F4801DRAFT_596627 [Xylaria longipes]|nr:hypothetical protein F4801DRAFT_596627 [Xylaria longipes]